ncbi:hypothetical protein F9278_04005 [Streptomyces phaeolivaceus]|uniref:Lipoprotein n=1 Tax=Streptomyces phaeolivaceus TaxID=2653200 RepID=A0A5P8JYL5_9ACTN|nr:hypothetical protein [Streptomyces phaeolivaceus]QFQ95487.1 hypothetical protein F9278_04005 [Streptomyces phaeolivaceus]
MGTGKGRFGVVVAAALAVVLTGCGGAGDGDHNDDGSGARPQPSSATRTPSGARATGEGGGDGTRTGPSETDPPTPPKPSPTRTDRTEPDSGTAPDTAACFDGRCRLTVSKPLSIDVDSRFGVGELRVTKVTDDTVVLQSSGAGTFLSSSLGEGGTGGLNGLGFRVESLEGGTAVLEFFPRA